MVLVDTNIIVDILSRNPHWGSWSEGILEDLAQKSELAINPVIYAELSVAMRDIEDVEKLVSFAEFHYLDIPKEAAFLTGIAFGEYKRKGGFKRSPLPDFFIGAHAAVLKIPLVTRDVKRYRTYFPKVKLICPG